MDFEISKSRFLIKILPNSVHNALHDEKSPDDEAEPFNNKRFHTGDLLDVAITPNRNPKPEEKKEQEKKVEVESLDTDQKQSAEEPKRLESTEDNMGDEVKTVEVKNVAEPDPLMDDDDDDEDVMDA